MLTVSGSHSREPAGLRVFSVSVAAASIFLFFSVIVRDFYLFVCLFGDLVMLAVLGKAEGRV